MACSALARRRITVTQRSLDIRHLRPFAVPAYAFTVTFVLLKVMARLVPLRASQRDEAVGMDVTQYGVEAYVTGEGAILITPDDGEEVAVASRA